MLELNDMLASVNEEGPMKPGKSERPVVLITTVDIGGGKSDKIEIRKGDEPSDAARAFCQKHGLPDSVVGPLTMHILDNLKKAGKKLEQESLKASRASSVKERIEEAAEECAPPKQPQPKHEQLSFANGMNDRLYEQLHAKLLPVDDSNRLLTVTAANSGMPMSNRMGSVRSSSVTSSERQHRKSRSADPSPRDTVFRRLYSNALEVRSKHDAKRKMQAAEVTASISANRSSMSWISQEMMRDRTHGPFDNYGEMLYAEGLEATAMRRSKAAMIRAEREQRELDGATFAPEITRLAKALWSGADLDSQPAWQRLSVNKRNKTLAAINEIKRAREEAEMQECTFKPAINKTSAQLMADRSEALRVLQVSPYEQLFQDALRRQAKQRELQGWLPEEATFKPQVNKSGLAQQYLRHSYETLGLSNGSEGSACAPDAAVRASTVVDRLYMSMEKAKLKKEEARERLYGSVDPETGRPLYRPEVGRGPKNVARNREGMPIGEYLYHSGLEHLNRKEAELEAEREAERAAANSKHATANSQRMFERLKAKRFGQIFEYLDEAAAGVLDIVGLVRQPTARMDNLDAEVREDVELAAEIHARDAGVQLLSMMADGVTRDTEATAALPSAQPVELATFSALMEEALLKKRKPRAYLVPSPSSKYQPNHSFKPTINPRSKQMAARLRPQELSAHEILHHNAEAQRAKLEAMRREQEEAALQGCTFQPRLNNPLVNGRPVEGRALRAAGTMSSQAWSASPSALASPRANTMVRSSAQAAVAAAAASSGATEMPSIDVLEREMQAALAAAQAATGDAEPGSVAPQVTASPHSQRGEVDPADIAATQEFLMDILGTDADAAGEDVLEKLNQYLQSMQVQQEAADGNGKAEVASADVHIAPARRGTKEAAPANSVNLFVVPAPSTEARIPNGAIEQLAQSMDQWAEFVNPAGTH